MSDPLNQIETIATLSVPRYAPRLQATPIPGARWDDEPLYCLKVNDEWVSHILGVLGAMDQPDTWVGTPDEIYDARQQVNEIMVAFMENCDPMSNCCPEPLTRITDDGSLEVSYDGGMTWTPATTEDPRNTAPQLPPLTGDDGNEKRCSAANNVLGQFKDGISTFSGYFDTTTTVVGFATAVAGFIVAIIFAPFAVPIVVGAIIAFITAFWSAGKTAYDAAFDDSVYGDLLCILYCHVQNDGTFTADDFSAIRADISSHFGSIARDAFLALLHGVSLAGLNNLAKIPTGSSASCDSCGCECATDIWSIFNGTEDYGTIVDIGDNYITCDLSYAPSTTGEYFLRMKTLGINQCCSITNIEIISGGSINIASFADCGATQDGTCPHAIGGSYPTPDTNCFVIGSAAAMRVKISFA